MTALIKQAIRLGNSAGVILPKSWEYRKVRVELVDKSTTKEIFELINEKNLFSEVIGIYLVGSYARGEETPDSDIDILVITDGFNKTLKKGNYEILFISQNKLENNFGRSLYLYSMIKEAKAILNESLIKRYKNERFSLDRKLLDEIKSMVKINRVSVDLAKELGSRLADGVVYSIILRLREIYMMACLIRGKNYTNKGFLKILKKIGSKESYFGYLRIKKDLRERNNITAEEAERLLDYSEKLIKSLKW